MKRNENCINSSTSTRETVYISGDDDTVTIDSTTVTEHPLLDAIDLLCVDDGPQAASLSAKAASEVETSAPLSSLAFKKRRSAASSSSSRRRISWQQQQQQQQQQQDHSTNSASRRKNAPIDARPPLRRAHSTHDCSPATARKKNEAVDITDAEQLIIQLKLELAEAKGEVECQATKINKLTNENEKLNLRIKEYEVNSEVHQVTANSLEDATLEIQELLRENQILASQVDTVTYQRNEFKNKLGIMTVSKPPQKGEEQMSSASKLKTCEESNSPSLPDNSSQEHLRGRAVSRSGSGCSLDHRASALALMSSFRSSIRRIASGDDGPEQVSVDELLWDDDAGTCGEQQQKQQERFAAQGA